ncbi:MAG: hypothetical protein ABEJ28_01575 [Salinigranum sp.]
MSAPEESYRIASDDSKARDRRTDAIDDLELANECGRLAALVRDDALEESLRRRALSALASPQCASTLADLATDESLPASLRGEAADLSEELGDPDGTPGTEGRRP